MKNVRFLAGWGLLLWLSSLTALAADSATKVAGKVRVLVVTGGHDFEKEQFFKVFKDNPDISLQAVEHPKAQALFQAGAAKDYDVIVMYDFNQPIDDEAKANFVARLKEGKGLVVLHHAIATYPKWPEYWKIIGAHYYLEKTTVDGVEKARSAYKHGMDFTLRVADPGHPVTRGVKDYEIHDETYKWFDVAPECHPLLTTDEPESNKVVAWAKTYENARVVYMQSGHDHFAYENPNFQRVLRQAIGWVAKRET
jgi:type 1 glutamine amidotransferase